MNFKFGAIFIFEFISLVFSVKYRMIYEGDELCPDPDPPYDRDQKVVMNIGVVNTTNSLYYNANFTVKENLSGYTFRFKTGFEKSRKIIYENDYKGLTCKSFIFKVLSGLSSIKFDRNTCEIFKGNYTVNNLDISTLDRAVNFLPTRRVGINVYFLSYSNLKETCFCIQSRILFVKV